MYTYVYPAVLLDYCLCVTGVILREVGVRWRVRVELVCSDWSHSLCSYDGWWAWL